MKLMPQPKILLNFVAAIALATIIWGGLYFYAQRMSIQGTKVANVASIVKQEAAVRPNTVDFKPVSKISIGSPGTPFAGYAADVKQVCRGPLPLTSKPTLLMTETKNGWAAMWVSLSPATCKLLMGTDEATPTYVASDTPFFGVDSTVAYFVLGRPDSGIAQLASEN